MKLVTLGFFLFITSQLFVYGQETPDPSRNELPDEAINLGKALANEVDDDTVYILMPNEYPKSFERIVKIKDNRVIFFAYETHFFYRKDKIPCRYEFKNFKERRNKIIVDVYHFCDYIRGEGSYTHVCKLKVRKT